MSKAYEQLQPYLERAQAFQTAKVLFEWDNETLAPKKAGQNTSKVVGTLSSEYFSVITDPQVKKLVKECQEEDLGQKEAAIVRELAEEIEKLERVPANEYREFSQLASEGTRIWADARRNKDFESFAPTLKKLVEYTKKFASYRAKEGQKLYDVLLEDYEKGFDMETLDRFFGTLRQQLVPFLKKVTESEVEIEDDFLTGDYKDEDQEAIGRFFAEYVGFDFDRGVMAVSAHPFTTNLHNKDVRVTTSYNRHVDDSLFSVIHESGHAIYELGIPDELTQTLVGGGASMGMHESQSRFFENIIGRNEAFWAPVYPKLQQQFPQQLKDVPVEKFVKAVNKVEPSLIRTQADELTYSLHVMIRYEIEKMLIQEDLDVDKLPEIWADKYEEYLGVRPKDAAEGVLQDIHWSQGSFGYFPSYALGSAFGAQLYHYMKGQLDFEGLLRAGEIGTIREFLRQHIHQYGKLKTSRQMLKEVTGEDFNPQYYIDYLVEKYGRLYGVTM
ncbi:MAG: carboxypeptidase M32 [Hungatella sp.]|nr:carboxypeptidase M32 [Hungatella sp.]